MRPRLLLALGLLASAAAAFLVANSPSGGRFVFESLPADRRPANLLVDTEAVPGVSDPVAVTQDLMNQWNAVDGALPVFGTATAGGPYNGSTVGQTFGVFSNRQFEVAFDDTGGILAFFGLGSGVLGITLKSVDTGSGRLLDFLVVINTQPGTLSAPGTGATAEELFRATLLHELGHAAALGHTPVGMVNTTSFGLLAAPAMRIPTMYPFRIPQRPQEGGSLEADDAAALIEVYPDGSAALGSISGSVRAISGAPINEIAVRVVGPVGGGDHQVGIITNADSSGQGRFSIPNLEPGGYRVILEAINGRGSVDSIALAGGTGSLGGNPFQFAQDEFWQPGDSYDPAIDDPSASATVQVRAGRDTGSIDFVLNAAPLLAGADAAGSLARGDSQIGDAGGGFHYVDYHVFQGNAGDALALSASASSLTPQLLLLAPGDMQVISQDLPFLGTNAAIAITLPSTGIYTAAISARATTGNPGGTGTYTLSLRGSGGALPAPPIPTPATVSLGAGDPGTQAFASPVCALPVLQVRPQAPSHEDLWVDRVVVRASGSGDDARDVTGVRLVRDQDGDGRRDGGESELAAGTFTADNGSLTFDDLDLVVAAGTGSDLLVIYDITAPPVAAGGAGAFWFLLALLPLAWLGRRRLRAVVPAGVLALVLGLSTSCGGGGGGSGCNGPFDPAGAVLTFEATVEAGGIVAFTPTSDPGTPLGLPQGRIRSGTLSVSH